MDEKILNITPRDYQKNIFETCKDKNCLVVLPTGIGKTLIALMLAVYLQEKFPTTKVLFLAPTRPLAEQHLEYFKNHLPELYGSLDIFTGKINAEKRKKLWQNSDIIFSTPQCISNDVKKGLYNLNDVSLLIEDECHRCLKNYSYTYIVKKYKEQSENQRILGLTASPGTEKKIINEIADNLGIEAIEVRNRESEDVKQYIQKLEFDLIKLKFPEEFVKIRSLLKNIFDKKVSELKNRKLLFMPPTKKFLLDTQNRIMRAISSGNKNFNLFAGASAAAVAIKIHHAMELLETQTLHSLQLYLYGLFDQANQKKSKAVQQLVKQPEFNQVFIAVNELIAKRIENPKLEELKNIISKEINFNSKVKILIFSQYRDNVNKICKELNTIEGVKSRIFIGQAKKINRQDHIEEGLSQREQQEIIQQFSSGDINILVSTSIGEEGLDIPEVNAVIFYEPVPSAIRKIQRAGRTARLSKGKLIILMIEGTRDEAYHWAAFHKEKKMYAALDSVKRDLENKNNSYFQQKLF